jgi:site-specific DNA recombinase
MSKGLAIIYDRASTKKQEENYTRQDVKRVGSEIARRHGYDTEADPRFEVKSGEELRNRPVMLGILEDIQAGKIIEGQRVAAIIVPSLTRLSRDEDIIDGLIIKKTCRDNDVAVIDFYGKVYNFDNANDQDAAFLEFWFAARDKRQIVANTLRGAKEKAMQGKYMGGFAAFGYRLVESGEMHKSGRHLKKRIIDPSEAKVVKRIYKLYRDHSADEIAAMLNTEGTYFRIKNPKIASRHKSEYRPFSAVDIIRIVKNPLYAGWIRWGTGVKGRRSRYLRDFEPQMHFDKSIQIISQDEFDRAQRIRKARINCPARAATGFHPFTRILKCVHCGGQIVSNYTTDKFNKRPKWLQSVYRCTEHFANPSVCPEGQIIATYPIAYAVIELIKSVIQDKMRLSEALMEAAQRYSEDGTMHELENETKAQLEKTGQAIERVTRSIAEGTLSDNEARTVLQELRDKKERLTRDLKNFEESRSIKLEILEAVRYISGDLDGTLWDMLEHRPRTFARVLRLLFKPHSVSVQAYWDLSVKGHVSTLGKRKARVVDYELQESFSNMLNASPQLRAAFGN